jgi:internalin A
MRKYLGLLIVLLFVGIASAQESPYEIALQRIEEAEARGARELDLCCLGLTELPSELFTLSSVEYLYLQRNQLSSLPLGLFTLSSLEYVNLSNNQLTRLPPEIAQLSNLHLLGIEYNQLTELPAEIGNLSNLDGLWLRANQLNSLPPEIGKLENLCQLDLTDNRLQYLPVELGRLTRLAEGTGCRFGIGIYLEGNPLISPPSEVVAQGTEAILAYLHNEAWWHLQKLIVSGLAILGVVTLSVLGLRWKNRRGKQKRKNGEAV